MIVQLQADSPERDANEIPLLAKLQTQSKHSPLTLALFSRIITRNRDLKTGGGDGPRDHLQLS